MQIHQRNFELEVRELEVSWYCHEIQRRISRQRLRDDAPEVSRIWFVSTPHPLSNPAKSRPTPGAPTLFGPCSMAWVCTLFRTNGERRNEKSFLKTGKVANQTGVICSKVNAFISSSFNSFSIEKPKGQSRGGQRRFS